MTQIIDRMRTFQALARAFAGHDEHGFILALASGMDDALTLEKDLVDAIALAATPGPWRSSRSPNSNEYRAVRGPEEGAVTRPRVVCYEGVNGYACAITFERGAYLFHSGDARGVPWGESVAEFLQYREHVTDETVTELLDLKANPTETVDEPAPSGVVAAFLDACRTGRNVMLTAMGQGIPTRAAAPECSSRELAEYVDALVARLGREPEKRVATQELVPPADADGHSPAVPLPAAPAPLDEDDYTGRYDNEHDYAPFPPAPSGAVSLEHRNAWIVPNLDGTRSIYEDAKQAQNAASVHGTVAWPVSMVPRGAMAIGNVRDYLDGTYVGHLRPVCPEDNTPCITTPPCGTPGALDEPCSAKSMPTEDETAHMHEPYGGNDPQVYHAVMHAIALTVARCHAQERADVPLEERVTDYAAILVASVRHAKSTAPQPAKAATPAP